ncbi:MAG: ribonuclease [Holophagaceae bacterium]|nr:ribonuclease [Holophagaceae bacterium]
MIRELSSRVVQASSRVWVWMESALPTVAGVLRFVWEVLRKYHHDDCLTYAAGISFFLTLSALPLATLFFKLMALVLGNQAYSQTMQRAIGQMYPYLPANVMGDAVRQSRQVGGWGLGWLILIVGAHWGVNQLDRSLCHIFGLRFKTHRQTRQYHVLRRLGIIVGGLLFLAMLLTAGFEWTLRREAPFSPLAMYMLLPPFLVLIVGTQVLQHLPRRHVRFRHALLGGVVTMVLWWGAKWGFGWYLAHTPTWGILYGTLGSLMAGLVFLYYSCCIFLLGAEVTAAFYRHDTTTNVRVPEALRRSRS